MDGPAIFVIGAPADKFSSNRSTKPQARQLYACEMVVQGHHHQLSLTNQKKYVFSSQDWGADR